MNGHDDFGGRLADALSREAGEMSPELLSFDEVRRHAGRIRRRRVAATTVAAAVAVVGVGGGTWAVLGDRGDQSRDVTAAAPTFHRDGPTPSITPGTENDHLDKSGEGLPSLDPRALEQGEAPKVDWLSGDQLHTADGRVLTLDREYTALHPWDDGWLAETWSDNGGTELTVLDSEGRPQESFASTGAAATSSDRSQVLFNDGNTLKVHNNTTGTTREIFTNTDDSTAAMPVGITDDGVVHYNVATANTDEPGDSRVWQDGQVTDPSPGEVQTTVAVNRHGQSVRMVQVTEARTCSAVFDADGTEQARTCEFQPAHFSPDGHRIVAWSDWFDGAGPLEVALLGEDWGEPLLDFVNHTDDPEDELLPGPTEAVWEDDDHFLLTMFNANDLNEPWYVVRVDTDGNAEVAGEPITPADEYGGVSLNGA